MGHTTNTALHTYIELDEAFFASYEAYDPDQPTLVKVQEVQPVAHVVIPSRYTCPDCVRNLPAMARIAEYLPDWTWEVFDSTMNKDRMEELGITHIPTFIVYDGVNGQELGRIIENPSSGALETDLLDIVRPRPQR